MLGFLREIVLVALQVLTLVMRRFLVVLMRAGAANMVAANFPSIPVRGSRSWH